MTEILTNYAWYLLITFIILLLSSFIIFVSLEIYTYIKEKIEEIKEIEK